MIILLLIAGMVLPFTRMVENARTLAWQAEQATIERARANPDVSEYERSAILLRITTINSEIVYKQHFANNSWFSMFYPESVREVELLP